MTKVTRKSVWVPGISQTQSDGKIMFTKAVVKEVVQVHSSDEEDGINDTEADIFRIINTHIISSY